jgi:hypothetical protein
MQNSKDENRSTAAGGIEVFGTAGCAPTRQRTGNAVAPRALLLERAEFR